MANQPETDIFEIIDSDVPNIYFNSFGVATSPHDLTLFLMRNGKPVAVLNASHSVAKTFANALNESIIGFEQKTNTLVLTSDELHAMLENSNSDDDDNDNDDE